MDRGLCALLLGFGEFSARPFFAVFEGQEVFVGGRVDALLFCDVFVACCVEGEGRTVWFEGVVEDWCGDWRWLLLISLIWIV